MWTLNSWWEARNGMNIEACKSSSNFTRHFNRTHALLLMRLKIFNLISLRQKMWASEKWIQYRTIQVVCFVHLIVSHFYLRCVNRTKAQHDSNNLSNCKRFELFEVSSYTTKMNRSSRGTKLFIDLRSSHYQMKG